MINFITGFLFKDTEIQNNWTHLLGSIASRLGVTKFGELQGSFQPPPLQGA